MYRHCTCRRTGRGDLVNTEHEVVYPGLFEKIVQGTHLLSLSEEGPNVTSNVGLSEGRDGVLGTGCHIPTRPVRGS